MSVSSFNIVGGVFGGKWWGGFWEWRVCVALEMRGAGSGFFLLLAFAKTVCVHWGLDEAT